MKPLFDLLKALPSDSFTSDYMINKIKRKHSVLLKDFPSHERSNLEKGEKINKARIKKLQKKLEEQYNKPFTKLNLWTCENGPQFPNGEIIYQELRIYNHSKKIKIVLSNDGAISTIREDDELKNISEKEIILLLN